MLSTEGNDIRVSTSPERRPQRLQLVPFMRPIVPERCWQGVLVYLSGTAVLTVCCCERYCHHRPCNSRTHRVFRYSIRSIGVSSVNWELSYSGRYRVGGEYASTGWVKLTSRHLGMFPEHLALPTAPCRFPCPHSRARDRGRLPGRGRGKR